MVSDLPPVVSILVYHQLGTILPTPISGHLKDLILADLQVEEFFGMFILFSCSICELYYHLDAIGLATVCIRWFFNYYKPLVILILQYIILIRLYIHIINNTCQAEIL